MVVFTAGIGIVINGGRQAADVQLVEARSTGSAEPVVMRFDSAPVPATPPVQAMVTRVAPVIRAGPALGAQRPASPSAAMAANRAEPSAAPSASSVLARQAEATPAASSSPAPALAAIDLSDDPAPRPLSAASSAATATPTATPAPPAEPESITVQHEVRPGENLGSIARRYGVTVQTILSANKTLLDRDVLKVGLQLAIPSKDGVIVPVRWGDTLSELATKYGVDPDAIIAFKANNLSDANSLREGELILIPGGKEPEPPRPTPTPTPPPTPVPTRTSTPTPAPVQQQATAASRASTPVPPPAPAATTAPRTQAASAGGWMWPASGPLSSYYGPSHPLGIDIDLYGKAGSPIVASRGGTVTFAGGNPCCSYGYYVEIDHGDGSSSLYAHFNSPPPVRTGQRVERGQVVGYAGTTGYSTGVHLHFEIRRNGATQNPLSYLP